MYHTLIIFKIVAPRTYTLIIFVKWWKRIKAQKYLEYWKNDPTSKLALENVIARVV